MNQVGWEPVQSAAVVQVANPAHHWHNAHSELGVEAIGYYLQFVRVTVLMHLLVEVQTVSEVVQEVTGDVTVHFEFVPQKVKESLA